MATIQHKHFEQVACGKLNKYNINSLKEKKINQSKNRKTEEAKEKQWKTSGSMCYKQAECLYYCKNVL